MSLEGFTRETCRRTSDRLDLQVLPSFQEAKLPRVDSSFLYTLALAAFALPFAALVDADAVVNRVISRPCFHHTKEGPTIYNFSLVNIEENEKVDLARFKGNFFLEPDKRPEPSLMWTAAISQKRSRTAE